MNGLLDPCGGMLLVRARTWRGKRHFVCMLRSSRGQGKKLNRSYTKERKFSPGCFSGQINSNQSSQSWGGMALSIAIYTLHICTWHILSAGVCSCLTKVGKAAKLLLLSGWENPEFQTCFNSMLASGQLCMYVTHFHYPFINWCSSLIPFPSCSE